MLVGGQVAAKLIGLLAFAYLARILDPDAYGEVEFVVGLAGLSAMVVDLGLSTIGVRRAAAAPADRGRLAAQIFLIRLAVALVCGLLMVLGVNLFGGSPALHGLVLLYALSLLISAGYQEWLLQSAGLMAQVALAQILRMSVFIGAVLLLVHGAGDAVLVGAAEIAAIAIAAGYALHVQSRKIAPIPEPIPTVTAILASAGLSRSLRASSEPKPALIWAVGPSRPPEPPDPIVIADATILTSETRARIDVGP